ncbi:hypothetical protein O9929_18425 [Vibrio lentus]|nr:hypothetical protein [Vibrio lentus]
MEWTFINGRAGSYTLCPRQQAVTDDPRFDMSRVDSSGAESTVETVTGIGRATAIQRDHAASNLEPLFAAAGNDLLIGDR